MVTVEEVPCPSTAPIAMSAENDAVVVDEKESELWS